MATVYHRNRPAYPDELVDRACRIAGLTEGDHVLEIGCGSGRSRAASSSAVCSSRRSSRASGSPGSPPSTSPAGATMFVNARFEDAALPAERFRAVFSAAAFHWVDPGVGWRKVAAVLVPNGTLALLQYCGLLEERSARDLEELLGALSRIVPEIAAEWPSYRTWPRRSPARRSAATTSPRHGPGSAATRWCALRRPTCSATCGSRPCQRCSSETADELDALLATASFWRRISAQQHRALFEREGVAPSLRPSRPADPFESTVAVLATTKRRPVAPQARLHGSFAPDDGAARAAARTRAPSSMTRAIRSRLLLRSRSPDRARHARRQARRARGRRRRLRRKAVRRPARRRAGAHPGPRLHMRQGRRGRRRGGSEDRAAAPASPRTSPHRCSSASPRRPFALAPPRWRRTWPRDRRRRDRGPRRQRGRKPSPPTARACKVRLPVASETKRPGPQRRWLRRARAGRSRAARPLDRTGIRRVSTTTGQWSAHGGDRGEEEQGPAMTRDEVRGKRSRSPPGDRLQGRDRRRHASLRGHRGRLAADHRHRHGGEAGFRTTIQDDALNDFKTVGDDHYIVRTLAG